ncbi:MAG: DNA integrity scanning protein DisA nucleotide-binding domain protein [Candidatus Omnitrophota bacterium]
MDKILSDSLIWFTLLAALAFLVFLLRGLKTIYWKLFVRLFISLSCLCAGFILFPRPISLTLIRYVAAIIIIAAVVAILIDIFSTIFLKVRCRILSGRDFTMPLPDYLMEICQAMEVMANRKIGALIVIESKDKLQNYVSNGIFFDAQIKNQILIALFSSASPVHDGAVIIANGRIRRVKAILPLKTDVSLPMGIGTRHRSAIAITEKTDAIALAVSEERGEMSIAYRGRLLKIGSMKEMYRLIKTALKGRSIGVV